MICRAVLRGGLLALAVAACGDRVGDGTSDAGAPEPDASPRDAAVEDAHPVDAGPADAAPATGTTGAPCTEDSDCVEPNTLCLRDGFPGGYCTIMFCGTFGDPCGTGGACAPLPGRGPFCFRTCTDDADCREAEGYACEPSAFIDAQLCVPSTSGNE